MIVLYFVLFINRKHGISKNHDIFVIYIFLQNDYNLGKFPREPIKPAAAARIYGDKSAFYSCGFLGLQDTLWDVQGRHYFSDCYIEGAVDFICGDGQSFYQVKSSVFKIGSVGLLIGDLSDLDLIVDSTPKP